MELFDSVLFPFIEVLEINSHISATGDTGIKVLNLRLLVSLCKSVISSKLYLKVVLTVSFIKTGFSNFIFTEVFFSNMKHLP